MFNVSVNESLNLTDTFSTLTGLCAGSGSVNSKSNSLVRAFDGAGAMVRDMMEN